MRKPERDVESLKKSWEQDPCWDIEDTEGFEDHREELLAFSCACRTKWEMQKRRELADWAQKYGLSHNLELAMRLRRKELEFAEQLRHATNRITELEAYVRREKKGGA